MSAFAVCITLVVFLLLGVPVTFLILRDEQRRRREWRPDGYSAQRGADWWLRPLPSIGLRNSVRDIDTPPSAELISISDPRIVRGNRLGAPTNGGGSAPKRAQRVRRIEKKRKAARARGAA